MATSVREPEAVHIRLLESLVFSDNPSARVTFGGLTLRRSYEKLCADREQLVLPTRLLPMEGVTELPEIGLAVRTLGVLYLNVALGVHKAEHFVLKFLMSLVRSVHVGLLGAGIVAGQLLLEQLEGILVVLQKVFVGDLGGIAVL